MRHQRLRVIATVEFPVGYQDREGRMLGEFKSVVVQALREKHLDLFGNGDWPAEIHAVAGWSLGAEEALV